MVQILLVDDHFLVRSALKRLVERNKGFKVVAEASNGEEAIEMVRKHSFDVVTMDLSMPIKNGIEATKEIRTFDRNTPILAISMNDDPNRVKQMMEAGANGYILKTSSYDEIVEAIKEVVSNNIFISRELSKETREIILHFIKNNKTQSKH